MRPVMIGFVLAGLCGVCALGGTAHADRADQLFKKGKKLLAEKRYAEACTAFEDSDRIDPGIGAKLNVARCYQEWGKFATAWRWFSDAEQMAKGAKDDRAAKIHEILEELDASVPRLTVKAPRGASTDGIVVKLDGVALEAGALGTELRVDPGPHQIDYVASGKKKTKTIPVERGGSSEVTLDLPSKTQASRPNPSATVTAEGGTPDPTRRLIGLGITGAGAVAMGVAGIVTYRARSDYKHALSTHCRGDRTMCDADGVRVTHGALHRANISTIVTLGGLAAVASGLIVYLTAPIVGERGEEHALYLAPSIDADGSSVVLGGRF